MMKIMKLDRRNAGFPKWKYALDFGRKIRDITPRAEYAREFFKMYGPDATLNPDREPGDFSKPFWLHNENWSNDNRRGRIYFNNEADITFIELTRVK